jgi:hypothetical protein
MSTKSRRTIYGGSIMGAGALTMRPVVQTIRMTSSGQFFQANLNRIDRHFLRQRSKVSSALSLIDASALAVLVLC